MVTLRAKCFFFFLRAFVVFDGSDPCSFGSVRSCRCERLMPLAFYCAGLKAVRDLSESEWLLHNALFVGFFLRCLLPYASADCFSVLV